MKRNLYLLSAGLILCSCSEPTDVVTGHARVIMKSAPVTVAPATIPTPAVESVVSVSEPEIIAPAPSSEEISVVAQKQPVTTEPLPAPAPIEEKPATDLVAQNQPVTSEPAPAPVEEEPTADLVAQNQPVTTEPAPVPAEEKPEAAVITQNQPAVAAPAPTATATDSEVKIVLKETTPAPTPEVKKPEMPVVAQNQPITADPAPAPVEKKPEPAVVAQKQPVITPKEEAIPAAAASVYTQTKTTGATIISTTPDARTSSPRPAAEADAKPVTKPAVSQQQPRTTAPSNNYRTPQNIQPKKRSYPIMPGQNRGLRNRFHN